MSNVAPIIDKRFENAADFMAGGFVVEAEAIYKDYPENPEALNAMAMIALSSGKFDIAEDYLRDAISIDDTAEHNFALASILKTKGADCLATLEHAYSLSDASDIAFTYASELIDCNDHPKAVIVLEKALAGESDNVLIKMKLAAALIGCSEIEKANQIHAGLIKQHPDFLPAYIGLAQNTKHKTDTLCQPDQLEHFLDRVATKKEQEPSIHSALGKVYEDLGEYDKAFEHYQACNDKQKDASFSHAASGKVLKDVVDYYTPERFESVEVPDEDCPLVFICGMPRSGSTLIEQTLACHPDIETKGETSNMGEQIRKIAGGYIPESPSEAMEAYMKEYMDGSEARFIVDKMPGNYQYLGLMYQLFPKAKFIITQRDAMSNCFSCYATNFARGHKWAMDLEDCAKEYNRHLEYVKHWQKVLPEESIMIVSYEAMVADHESTSREILEWIGVEWDESCSKFYELKRNVKTASLAQVVKPIYTTSVSRAEKFGDLVTPLATALYEKHLQQITTESNRHMIWYGQPNGWGTPT